MGRRSARQCRVNQSSPLRQQGPRAENPLLAQRADEPILSRLLTNFATRALLR